MNFINSFNTVALNDSGLLLYYISNSNGDYAIYKQGLGPRSYR